MPKKLALESAFPAVRMARRVSSSSEHAACQPRRGGRHGGRIAWRMAVDAGCGRRRQQTPEAGVDWRAADRAATLAHEFGHILGFTDGYVRGYADLGEKGFEILELTSFFDDIMSAPREGHVQPTHFKLLLDALE